MARMCPDCGKWKFRLAYYVKPAGRITGGAKGRSVCLNCFQRLIADLVRQSQEFALVLPDDIWTARFGR
jgi:hypothetical protein